MDEIAITAVAAEVVEVAAAADHQRLWAEVVVNQQVAAVRLQPLGVLTAARQSLLARLDPNEEVEVGVQPAVEAPQQQKTLQLLGPHVAVVEEASEEALALAPLLGAVEVGPQVAAARWAAPERRRSQAELASVAEAASREVVVVLRIPVTT